MTETQKRKKRMFHHHQAGDLAGLLPDLGGGKQATARRAVEPGRGRPDLRRVGGNGCLV